MIREPITYDGKLLLPITSDIMFKAVFSRPESRDLLVDLLNTYLKMGIASPEDIDLVAGEKLLRYTEDKLFRLDLRVKTASGEQVNIEIQAVNHHDIIERSLFYVTGMYHDQFEKGMPYNKGRRTVGLYFLCYNEFAGSHFKHSFIFREETVEGLPLKELLKVVYVELQKVPKEGADIWSRLLTAASEDDLKELEAEAPLIQKAVGIMKIVSEDDELRFIETMKRKAVMDEYSRRASALSEGMAKGIAKGKVEGKVEGREETQQEIALKLAEQGFSSEQIISLTGIDANKLAEISQNRAAAEGVAQGSLRGAPEGPGGEG